MVSGRWLGEEKEQVERKRVLTGADTRLITPSTSYLSWVSMNVAITGQAVYVIKLLLFYILPLQQNQLYHPLQSVRHYVNFWI
tara:strand:+ start:41 stop:289 length:249 start_codon:yes stop_codon:yes gene_type:complete